MASDDIWILGIAMTKFGKHSDKDIVDLGSEAAIAALADAGVGARLRAGHAASFRHAHAARSG